MSPAVYDVTIDYFWSTRVVCNVQIEYLTEPVVDMFSDIFFVFNNFFINCISSNGV